MGQEIRDTGSDFSSAAVKNAQHVGKTRVEGKTVSEEVPEIKDVLTMSEKASPGEMVRFPSTHKHDLKKRVLLPYSDRNGVIIAMSGTGMATPIVAGFVAFLLSAFPDATPAQIKEALRASADSKTPLMAAVVRLSHPEWEEEKIENALKDLSSSNWSPEVFERVVGKRDLPQPRGLQNLPPLKLPPAWGD